MTARRVRSAAAVAALAVTLVLLSGVVLAGRPQGQSGQAPVATTGSPGAGPAAVGVARLIEQKQRTVRSHPDRYGGWAQLGAAYVTQARITADPAYYPKAAGALQRSLRLRPTGNVEAMIGSAALANAQHEFRAALGWARRAVAADPYSATAYGVLADAHTQLGDYPAATAAIRRMLTLNPGVASYTRASYNFEQHGDDQGARLALEAAVAAAQAPADVAFCRYHLGELAWNTGNPTEALRQYGLGLKADPGDHALLAGTAKAHAALGNTRAALANYSAVVNRVPLPQYVIELGELQQSVGDRTGAAQQYALLAAELSMFTANGVLDDLTPAEFQADHGDPKAALRHAWAEWGRRHSVLVADTLAWALHRNGRHTEALTYARLATRLGWRNAAFRYHRGMIQLALGDRTAARDDLTAALSINPHFSPIQAPAARRALQQLDAS